MKIRNGFISNSSSCSFFIFTPKQFTSKEELNNYVIESYNNTTHDENWRGKPNQEDWEKCLDYFWKLRRYARITKGEIINGLLKKIEENPLYKSDYKDDIKYIEDVFNNRENDYCYYYYLDEQSKNDLERFVIENAGQYFDKHPNVEYTGVHPTNSPFRIPIDWSKIKEEEK